MFPSTTLLRLLIGLALLALFTPAYGAKRIALVIGNAQYQKEAALRNPINDARLIAEVLRKDLKFDEVVIKQDLGRRELNRAIAELTAKARGADAVVVYYSGHGMQRSGENFLIPVDAVIQQESDIDTEGVPSARLLAELEAAAPRVTVVVLDACRNNPFIRGTKSVSKGLARTGEVGDGMLVAYATRDGSTADDGSGTNSPYALALASQLRRNEVPIRLMFEQVADDVRSATNNKQRPITYGDLRSSVYLAGRVAGAIPSPSVPAIAPQPTAPPSPVPRTASSALVGSGSNTVRPELFKLLDPAEIKPLLEAKNFTEVQNRISQAEAIASRNSYEDYVINRMKLSLRLGSDNTAAAMPVMEAILASGYLTPAEQLTYYQALGDSNFNAKNYAKAVEWYTLYQKEGGDPAKVRTALSRAQALGGNFSAAREVLLSNINDAKKAGRKPAENDLRLLGQEANKAKDTEAYMYALENLVQYYPTDDFWVDLLNRGVARKAGFDEATYGAAMLRLQMAAVKQMPAEHYIYLAEVALSNGFPAEAKSVLDAGFAAGVLGKGGDAKTHAELRSKANKQAADDARTIASGEMSAAKAKTGAALVNLGWAYATMDQADKGIGFIRQGIAKGGLKAPDEAKLRLGMAQVRAGKKTEAIQTFQGISGKGGAADLVKYWVLLLQQQG